MKLQKITVLSIFLGWSFDAAAVNAEFLPGHHQTTLDVNIPSAISIPRDTPNGTLIYESPVFGLPDIPSSYSCLSTCRFGMKNNVGNTTPTDFQLPIGDTGLAWKLTRPNGAEYAGYPHKTQNKGKYGFNSGGFIVQILKIGNISNNAKIPAGIIGYWQVEELFPLAFQTNGTNFLSASCEIPDIAVEMGNYSPSDFGSDRANTTKPVNFNIKLNNCPPGITKVSYKLVPSTQTEDWRNGVFRLSSSSTAKDIALQIKNPDDTPVSLKTYYRFNGYDTKGGNFEIPLTARYYRIGREPIKAGSANAELTVVMEYL